MTNSFGATDGFWLRGLKKKDARGKGKGRFEALIKNISRLLTILMFLRSEDNSTEAVRFGRII